VSTLESTTAKSCAAPLDVGACYQAIRHATERLCEPLTPEDCAIQSMPDVSPSRWHLAHTTWFFETFVLAGAFDEYRPLNPTYALLFNSYYNAAGRQFPRHQRGLLSRPSLAEIYDYRRHVDHWMLKFLADGNHAQRRRLLKVVEIGLHHEQQHQELILTDIKHVFSCNPLAPTYRAGAPAGLKPVCRLDWIAYDEGLHWIGHDGEDFSYDHERPGHRQFVAGFELANRLVTCGEYLAFIEDGGYRRPEFWLSDGWRRMQAEGWRGPLYWSEQAGAWSIFTLAGRQALDPNQPVCHVSYYEADAFARWSQARLPTEFEWEVAANPVVVDGHFAECQRYHPLSLTDFSGLHPAQMFGDVWQWTASAYAAYPGYQALRGALGEYNGKFMCNQFVLRGGSCATPKSHMRTTYRNFFPPEARWQFSGIRLAR